MSKDYFYQLGMRFGGVVSLEELFKVAMDQEDISIYDVMQNQESPEASKKELSEKGLSQELENKNVAFFEKGPVSYLLHPSTYEEGNWQITKFIDGKHDDHMFFDTMKEALSYILSQKGFILTKSAYFDEFDRIKKAKKSYK